MKVFHCDNCDALVFFENVQCVSCGHSLAFLPDIGGVVSLGTTSDGTAFTPMVRGQPDPAGRRYRLCQNYVDHAVCNWAVEAGDSNPLCISCRLTTVIPDLANATLKMNWSKLETAKRRLIYTLLELRLPLQPKENAQDVSGLAFEFKAASPEPDAKPVLTGHADGLITINVAEADDAERERLRNQLHEPYRTLLGHFRHEIGHYYWDRLIAPGRLEEFRALFGDEQQDYGEALQRHYENGPPADWPQQFVSSYSSSHPWEDWAETWAHYLHMYDTLETAAECGVILKPRRSDEPTLMAATTQPERAEFDHMIESWFALTYVLNNLNRGLGQADAYPFVLSTPAIEKLRFVHETMRRTSSAGTTAPAS